MMAQDPRIRTTAFHCSPGGSVKVPVDMGNPQKKLQRKGSKKKQDDKLNGMSPQSAGNLRKRIAQREKMKAARTAGVPNSPGAGQRLALSSVDPNSPRSTPGTPGSGTSLAKLRPSGCRYACWTAPTQNAA